MGLIRHVGLISEVPALDVGELLSVAAAIQKQVTRDFGPIWNVQATVDAFARLEDLPVGYWPIIVRAEIDAGLSGIHSTRQGQPFALIQHEQDWPLMASHECLEMLSDPFGNLLRAGDSVKPGQGRVEYLVEVSDPVQHREHGYAVNGVLVSDFVTPNYYDPVGAPGVRYSYTGAVSGPREVRNGGYLTWYDAASDHWWQLIQVGTNAYFRDMGSHPTPLGSLRAMVDAMTPVPLRVEDLDGLEAMDAPGPVRDVGSVCKAERWREEIYRVTNRSEAPRSRRDSPAPRATRRTPE